MGHLLLKVVLGLVHLCTSSHWWFSSVVLGLASCTSSYVLLKLLPVRPDDNEDVAANGKKEDATHPGSVVGVDHVSDYLDHIEDQTDHSQNDPGHKQARFS